MKLALYALLIGAASAFAFEPVGFWPLMLVAFALILELLNRAAKLRHAIAIGYAFGVGQFVIGLNWIATAFTFQAAMPPALGWVAVVLLSLYLAVYPAIATAVAWKFSRDNKVAMLLLFAGGWAITEWLRGTMFTGFPWNPAAAILVPTPLITLSGLTGTYGLSAFVVLLSGALWLEYYKRWLPMVLIFGVTAVLWLLPTTKIPVDPLTILDVRVVQPNIGQENRWNPATDEQAWATMSKLTGPPSADPRLVLWPESAITQPLQDSRPQGQPFAQSVADRAASLLGPEDLLLSGGIAVNSADGQRIDSSTNSVFVIAPGGKILGRYDKAHLVPYGEYLPMRPLLSAIGLSRLAPGDMDFSSGPGPRSIDVGGHWGRVGFQLCYEIIFSGRVADEAHRPTFIFNPSNDAWFGRWGPPQHLAQARLRAAEEGLPVIRATPTGISAVIDAHGEVTKSLPWKTAGVIDAEIPPAANSPTLFARLGNLMVFIIGLALIGGGLTFAHGGGIVLRRRGR